MNIAIRTFILFQSSGLGLIDIPMGSLGLEVYGRRLLTLTLTNPNPNLSKYLPISSGLVKLYRKQSYQRTEVSMTSVNQNVLESR